LPILHVKHRKAAPRLGLVHGRKIDEQVMVLVYQLGGEAFVLVEAQGQAALGDGSLIVRYNGFRDIR
jgi:hypothetical protein